MRLKRIVTLKSKPTIHQIAMSGKDELTKANELCNELAAILGTTPDAVQVTGAEITQMATGEKFKL